MTAPRGMPGFREHWLPYTPAPAPAPRPDVLRLYAVSDRIIAGERLADIYQTADHATRVVVDRILGRAPAGA